MSDSEELEAAASWDPGLSISEFAAEKKRMVKLANASEYDLNLLDFEPVEPDSKEVVDFESRRMKRVKSENLFDNPKPLTGG